MGFRLGFIVVSVLVGMAWSGRSRITLVRGSEVAPKASNPAPGAGNAVQWGDSSVMVGSMDQEEIFTIKRATRPDTSFTWKSRIWLTATCFQPMQVGTQTPSLARLRIDSLWETVQGSTQGSGYRKGNLLMERRAETTSMVMEGSPLSGRFHLLALTVCQVENGRDTSNGKEWLPPQGAKDTLRWDLTQARLRASSSDLLPQGMKATIQGNARLDSIAPFGGEMCRFVRVQSSLDAPKVILPLPDDVVQKRMVINQSTVYVVPQSDLSQPKAATISLGLGMDGVIQSQVGGIWLDNDLRYIQKIVLRAQRLTFSR
ncbi:MAG: hypothetical protein IPK50_17990 [Fibrobacterota bacterium]|nr:MAG: hypothetical protein IPK50_17990 [Fibrobacterota bacterium]